jgi:hypothetical protein
MVSTIATRAVSALGIENKAWTANQMGQCSVAVIDRVPGREQRRTMHITLSIVLLLTLATTGCVNKELKSVEASREALDQCIGEHSETQPDCASLQEIHRINQLRYNETAKRLWGCLPEEEGRCPPPR